MLATRTERRRVHAKRHESLSAGDRALLARPVGAANWTVADVPLLDEAAAHGTPVVFHSAPDVLSLAKEAKLENVSLLKADDGGGKGFSLYQLDLSK